MKNRLGIETISDFLNLYKEYHGQDKIDDFSELINESLVSHTKTDQFVQFFEKVYKFELEIERVRQDNRLANLEKKMEEKMDVVNYQIKHLDLEEDQKQVFIDNFTKPKIIYEYIPYWYVDLFDEEEQNKDVIREMLIQNDDPKIGQYKLKEKQFDMILDHLDLITLNEIVIYLRNHRKEKEFGLFDRTDAHYLNKNGGISVDSLKHFANKILLIAKESLMVPPMLFEISQPQPSMTKIQLYKVNGLNNDVLSTAFVCIKLHQKHIKKYNFNKCKMDK